jgi:wyosine [tRNA(Phe)-imidazoG37] synthetase (radical SAM superfamily)
MRIIKATDDLVVELWPAGTAWDEPVLKIKSLSGERNGVQQVVIVALDEVGPLVATLTEAAEALAREEAGGMQPDTQQGNSKTAEDFGDDNTLNEIQNMIAFGPVPSRRLGRSLGVNNIPPKICTYACVYCQLGRTIQMQVTRTVFYEPEKVLRAVQHKVEAASGIGELVDYLTFVPDGEPTLDANLGREIELLRPLGIKIAVITNGSLIWLRDVREDLMKADWISLKVDSTREEVWRRLDRPHRSLQLALILQGMLEFAGIYAGELVTETMLVEGINDSAGHIGEVADFLAQLKPARAYLSIPTRPPAEAWVRPPAEEVINQAYQILSERVHHVECLIGYEGDAFAFTGDVERDLLSITAVHPMRREAVSEFLARAGSDWSLVRRLISQGQLVETSYADRRFYMRKLPGRRGRQDDKSSG